MRPLHKSACLEKTAHFDEISNSSEPAYAGRPIGGERESKDREMGVFNKHDHLCNGLNIIDRLLRPRMESFKCFGQVPLADVGITICRRDVGMA